MKEHLARGVAALQSAESALQTSRILWSTALVLIALIAAVAVRSALTGDWFRSGNDMIYILPALKTADATAVRRWLHGPWVGVELFSYYRPVTSLLWLAEYRAFGEHVASWQAVSLILHVGSTVMLAALLRLVFGSPIAACIGALAWAARVKIVEAIAWTPAQTDHFAAFFCIGALLVFQIALQRNRRQYHRALLFSLAALLLVLGLGSKEIAYPVPLLGVLLAFRSPGLSRSGKVGVAIGCGALLVGFVVWRIVAMHGLGFMPGQASAGRSNAAPLTPGKWFEQMWGFLLPAPLGPHALVPVPATLSLLATLAAVRRSRSLPASCAIALAGGAAVVFFLGGPDFLLLPDTYTGLATSLFAFGLVFFLLRHRLRDALFLLLWGLIAYLPLYHVVYNAAGNVTYLPGIYWALSWSILISAVLKFLGTDGESAV